MLSFLEVDILLIGQKRLLLTIIILSTLILIPQEKDGLEDRLR